MSGQNDIVINLTLDNKDFAVRVKDSSGLLKQMGSDLQKTAASAKSLDNNSVSLGKRFRDMVVTAGGLRFALMDINDVFLRLPASILKTAGELEQTQVLLAGLSTQATKSAREIEAATNFKFITDLAKRAPFEVSALSDAFVKLKSAGIDPTKGSLQTLVNSVAQFGGDSETLKRATVAIQQMAGKGVVSMEELRQQLGEAVPTAMQAMATGMGLSMADLTKAVSKGTVEAQDAINKMFVVLDLQSRGSADELMGTWKGTLAQLKTDWDLAALDIGKAGFSDAVKDVAKQLGALLNNNEFKRFAVDLGQDLASVVRAGADVVKFMSDYADILKVVATGVLIYKASSNFLAPSLVALKQGVGDLVAVYKTQSAAATSAALETQQAAITTVRANQTRLESERTTAAGIVASKQQELEFLRAIGAQQIAQANAMAAAYQEAVNRGQGVKGAAFGEKGVISQAAARDQLAAIEQVSAANTRARLQVQADMAAAAAAQKAAGAAAAEHAAQIVKIEAAGVSAGRGISAMKTAAAGAALAFNALGGWLTVLNLAITAGIYLWSTWTSEADKATAATERAKRAKQGLSNAADEADAQNTADQARARKAASQAAFDREQALLDASNGKNPGIDDKRRQRLAAIKQSMDEDQATIDKFQAEALSHKKVIADRSAKEEADIYLRQADDEVKAIENAAAVKRFALDKTFKDEDAAAGNDDAKRKAAALKHGNAIKGLSSDTSKQTKDLLQSKLDALDLSGTGDKANVAAAEAAGLQQRFDDVQNRLDNVAKAFEPNKVLNTKGNKGDKTPVESKIDAFIGNLKEQQAKMEAELPSLLSTFGKIDAAAGAIAEVQAKFESGDFTERVKGADGSTSKVKPSSGQLDIAKKQAAYNAQLSEVFTGIKALSDRANDLEPDYQHALAVLANPLTADQDKRSNQFDEFIAKLKQTPEALQDVANKVGISSDAVLSKLQAGSRKAATIDYAAGYKDLADQVDKYGTQILDTERDRTAASIALDNKLFQIRMDHLRQLAIAAGASPEQQQQLEDLIAKAQSDKAVLDARQLETPMQKMLRDWQDTTKQMQDASAQWGQETIDTFVNAAKTGKFEWKSLIEDILAGYLKIQAQKALGPALDSGFSAAGSFFTNLMSSFAGGFATGGVLSSMGSVPLKKYAAGGIANSPQMALIGEGDDNEAYVPLPDGRRIPVALQGAGAAAAPNVQVNVINQSGTPVSAQQSQPRFDGKQMILDVVLSAASTPGTFRDQLRQVSKS
jgi:tape measure domain-containing protein